MEFMGTLFVFVGGASAIYVLKELAARAQFVAFLNSVSPWAGDYAELIGRVLVGAVLMATLAAPIILMKRDSDLANESKLATVGNVGTISLALAGLCAIVVVTMAAICT